MGLAKSPSKLKKVVKRHDVTNPKQHLINLLIPHQVTCRFQFPLDFPGKGKKINKWKKVKNNKKTEEVYVSTLS